MNARKVIIDCDPGIDDALALMLALSSPELDVLGITITSGNVSADKGAKNALKILKWMDRTDIPVYLGERLPLVRDYVNAEDTHGEDGLGESGYDVPAELSYREGAVRYLADSLHHAASASEPLSIIALGPMTNLARLIKDHPDSLAGLGELVSMGGNYKSHGNCSPVAEYNYWCDPHAAKLVYEAFETHPLLSDKQIHMIGLDVTRKIVLTPNILEYICQIDPSIGEIMAKITRFYFDFHWKQEQVIGCVINDPLAVAYFIDRSLCHGFSAYTAVETEGLCMGQTVVDAFDFWKKKKNSIVLTETDAFRFMCFFISRICHTDPAALLPVLQQIFVPPADQRPLTPHPCPAPHGVPAPSAFCQPAAKEGLQP